MSGQQNDMLQQVQDWFGETAGNVGDWFRDGQWKGIGVMAGSALSAALAFMVGSKMFGRGPIGMVFGLATAILVGMFTLNPIAKLLGARREDADVTQQTPTKVEVSVDTQSGSKWAQAIDNRRDEIVIGAGISGVNVHNFDKQDGDYLVVEGLTDSSIDDGIDVAEIFAARGITVSASVQQGNAPVHTQLTPQHFEIASLEDGTAVITAK